MQQSCCASSGRRMLGGQRVAGPFPYVAGDVVEPGVLAPGSLFQVALDVVDDGQRGEIRTVADFGPSPCMIGTAELPLYFSSYAASMAGAVSLPPGSKVTS